jgi:outer membrane protein assembly factor BamE (lipoprotein component of BamABCDE complex)
MLKRKTRVLTVVLALFLGVAGFMVFFVSSEAVSADSFAQITDGMTEIQVRELLGVPYHIRRDAPDRTAFFYGGFLRTKWCSMEVFFGADGRVTGKFHDH